jgi:hypothetical protein
MTAGGGKNVTLVAAPGGEVDFAGNILANAPNITAGVNIGDATHSGVVHLNGNNTYGGLTTVTNATLGGRGIIAGSVLVVNGGHTRPGGGMTNNIAGNLTYTTGGEADFNLDSSATTGTNDQIILTGATSSVNGNGVSVGINSVTGTLDQTRDYVLITNLTGAGNSSIFASAPVWLGTPPINSANYSVITKGNQVVLHYSTAQIASGLASPNPAGRGVLVTFTVNASSPGNSITSVSLNASAIGGSSSVSLNSAGGSAYTNGVVISSTTAGGSYLLPVTVTDNVGGVNSYSIQLTVTSVAEVWSGGGSDTLWSTGPNWASGFAPVSGDSLTFAGTTQLTPNMQANYFVPWLAFSNNAGSFNITNDGTHTLTLNGSVTNNSSSAQTLSVPVSLGAAITLNAAAGNITLSNTITGSGGITAIGATNTLAGNTSYSGPTVVNSGVLALSGNDVLFGGATVGSGSTMVMSGSEAATALTINNTGTLLLTNAALLNNGNDYANIVDNGTLNYSGTNSQNLLGVISGSGGLTLNSGTLTLGAGNVSGAPAGETYTGPTVINGGTLNLNYNNPAVGALNTSSGITINGGKIVSLLSSALEGYNSPSASSAPLTINAGGLLDVSPQFTVNGSGFSAHIQGILYLNGGTISNNAAYMQQYGGWGLYNACFVNGGINTSIIADSEFCPVSVNLGTNTVGGTIFYITAGANQTIPGIDLEVSGALVYTHGTIDSGVIVGGNGTMRLDGLNTFSKFLTVSNNATLILGANGQLNTVGPTTSFGSQSGNPNVQNGQLGGTVYSGLYSSPVTILGTFIDTSTNVTPGIQTLSGILAGTGLFEVTGSNVQLVLKGTNNPFSGSIVVTNGALLKVAENTSLVAGTTNSATGVGSVNVYASSTLGGTGIIAGFATNNAGGTLNPGLGGAAGTTLTISNLTMLAGSTNTFAVAHGSIYDKVVAQTVSYGGTLNVTCANAAALAVPDTFQLFNASTSYGMSSFANINLPTLSAGLTWNTSNLGVNGTISVAAVVSSPPTLGGVRLSSGSLIMSGTNGTPFAQYRILSTNIVTAPIATWPTVFTGQFDVNGNYSYTNSPLTNATSFFRLVTP